MKKDVLQGAVLFWNPLRRIHSPKYTAIQDIKNRSKASTRLGKALYLPNYISQVISPLSLLTLNVVH